MKIFGSQVEAQSGKAHFWSDSSRSWEDLAKGRAVRRLVAFSPLAKEALGSFQKDRHEADVSLAVTSFVEAYILPRQEEYLTYVAETRRLNGWPV